MTATGASPMPTPDLGALLRKPPAKPTVRPVPDHTPTDLAPSPATRAPRVTPESPKGASAQRSETIPVRSAVAPPARAYRRSIALYLPRSVHRELQVQAVQRGTTATALILAAVNATHEAIGASLMTPDLPRQSRDLFDVPQERRLEEPQVGTTIRVTDAQYDALAELASRYSANRSAVITAALRLHLPIT